MTAPAQPAAPPINPNIYRAEHKPNEARFWEKVDKRGPDECWPWTGAKQRAGYGHFTTAQKKTITASRFAWMLANGPIPDGMHVLHRCDNRGCCNDAHLFIGDHLQNMRDMRLKGRLHRIALSDDQVRKARSLFGKIQGTEIAALLGVSPSVISGLKRGRTYNHVE